MKKEELKTRREFFKKAATTALPIIGAIVLAGNPVFAKVASSDPMGCNSGCTCTCSGSCKGTCSACSAGCSRSCMSGCANTCRKSSTR